MHPKPHSQRPNRLAITLARPTDLLKQRHLRPLRHRPPRSTTNRPHRRTPQVGPKPTSTTRPKGPNHKSTLRPIRTDVSRATTLQRRHRHRTRRTRPPNPRTPRPPLNHHHHGHLRPRPHASDQALSMRLDESFRRPQNHPTSEKAEHGRTPHHRVPSTTRTHAQTDRSRRPRRSL